MGSLTHYVRGLCFSLWLRLQEFSVKIINSNSVGTVWIGSVMFSSFGSSEPSDYTVLPQIFNYGAATAVFFYFN